MPPGSLATRHPRSSPRARENFSDWHPLVSFQAAAREDFQGSKRLCVPPRFFSHPLSTCTICRLVDMCECHIGPFAPNSATFGNESSKARRGHVRFAQTRRRPDAPLESGARQPTRLTRSDENMESPHACGEPSLSGGGPSGANKERHPIAGPGHCLFAVCIPPKDLDQDVARCARRRAPSSRSRPIFFAYITRTRPIRAPFLPARVDATLRRRLRRALFPLTWLVRGWRARQKERRRVR